jgi:TPR repeat protein/formylglycine-generating enzyme required for sulfatase activity
MKNLLSVALLFFLAEGRFAFTQTSGISLDLGSGVQMEFVRVPLGGAERERSVEIGDFSGNRPAEQVRGAVLYGPFSSARDGFFYYLGKTEVTEEQWSAVMGEGARSKLPVTGKTYSEILVFLDKLQERIGNSPLFPKTADGAAGVVRLPREAEWEFAARGGLAASDYKARDPYEDDIERYENIASVSTSRVREVGSLLPNPLGLHDMLGNVREFVDERFSESGGERLLKGGCYTSEKVELRSSSRTEHPGNSRAPFVGFRVAISAPVVTSLTRAAELREQSRNTRGDTPIDSKPSLDTSLQDTSIEGERRKQIRQARQGQNQLQDTSIEGERRKISRLPSTSGADWNSYLSSIRTLAASGDADAQGILSFIVQGQPYLGEPNEAVVLATASANKGSPYGLFALARLYLTGTGVAKNPEKATELFHESFPEIQQQASIGDPTAQLTLGVFYSNGHFVKMDDPEAVKWYRRAAEQGLAKAQFNLGVMYGAGEGVPKNDAEAVKWFRRAAEQGHAMAQNNLGVRYANGRGVPKDDAEAVKWYRRAAEQGLAEAQNNLGVRYANGRGVPKDDAEAVKWYRRAAEQGFAWAQTNLGVMYENGRGVPKDDAEAVKWYRRAAEQGFAWAQTNLGFMYENGRGVPKDDAEAIKWYRRAAGQGDDRAKAALDQILKNQ